MPELLAFSEKLLVVIMETDCGESEIPAITCDYPLCGWKIYPQFELNNGLCHPFDSDKYSDIEMNLYERNLKVSLKAVNDDYRIDLGERSISAFMIKDNALFVQIEK